MKCNEQFHNMDTEMPILQSFSYTAHETPLLTQSVFARVNSDFSVLIMLQAQGCPPMMQVDANKGKLKKV